MTREEMDTTIANIRKVRAVFEPEQLAKEEAERHRKERRHQRRKRKLFEDY